MGKLMLAHVGPKMRIHGPLSVPGHPESVTGRPEAPYMELTHVVLILGGTRLSRG